MAEDGGLGRNGDLRPSWRVLAVVLASDGDLGTVRGYLNKESVASSSTAPR